MPHRLLHTIAARRAALAAALLLAAGPAGAACTAAATGNWGTASTWSGCTGSGGLPGATDVVTIPSGKTVTLDVDATIGGLTFSAPTSNSALTHAGTHVLTVNGAVTINQPSSRNVTNAWNINGGSAAVTGLITFAGTSNTTSEVSQIVITSGQLNAFGGMSFAAARASTKVIDMSGGAGALNLKGALAIASNSCTLTAGTSGSVFNYADTAAAQTMGFFSSGAYDIVQFNNTSAGGVTLSAAITSSNVSGGVYVQSGTLNNGGFAISGTTGETFEVDNGASFEMSGTSSFPSGFTTTTLAPASRVRYLQTTTPLSVTSETYGHLDLAAAGTATQRLPAGAMTVQGDLTVGDGTHATTADLNTNATTLAIGGKVNIRTGSTLAADNANGMTVGGNWTNAGTFTNNASTVTFNGTGAQTVDNGGNAFAEIVDANASAGGLTFSSGFSASQLSADTSSLGAATTMYFEAGATFTITSLVLNGTASSNVTLRSTAAGTRWLLGNSGSQSVSNVSPQDSDASGGIKVFDYPAGTDLGNNVNWAVGVNPPASLSFTSAASSSLDLGWPAASPAPDSYTLTVSRNVDFSAPVTTLSTGLLAGTTSGLMVNTTYYARIASVINAVSSAWTATVSTATLAVLPDTSGNSWASVNVASITATWLGNGNPSDTRYDVDLSLIGDFSTVLRSTSVTSTSAVFSSLTPGTRYYARVRAVNRRGVATAYGALGSTTTLSVNPPDGFAVTSVTNGQLFASWNAAQPPADSYTFQIAGDNLFSAPASSSTAATSASMSSLTPNTTYFARVQTVIAGNVSAWSATLATSTLANAPVAAATPITAVYVTSMTVAWLANGNPAGATAYDVELSTASDFSGDIIGKSVTALSVDVDQLDSGATYYARVKAVNNGGTSTTYLSLGSTVTLKVPIPKNLTFTSATTTSLSASWSASSPAGDSYDLRMSADPTFSSGVSSLNTAALSGTISPLSVNTTYYAEVRSVISGAPYPWSAYQTTATYANAPTAAGTTWTNVGITSATVAWAANGNPAGTHFVVDLSTVPGFASAVLSASVDDVTATFTGLVPSSTYHARVRALGHSGAYTASLALADMTTGAPNPPSALAVSTTAVNALTATWTNSVPPADAFLLQVDDDPGFGSINASSATANPFATTAATLSPNTTYYLRVRSVLSGVNSAWTTATTTATLAGVPATAATTWSNLGQTNVTMSWAANGNPAGTRYVAEISDVADFSDLVDSSNTVSTSADFSTLLTDTDYWGRVKAVNRGGVETVYAVLGSTHTLAPNTCNAVGTGNWSAAGTWSNCTGAGGLPSPTDAVSINSGANVTLDVDATIAGLTFAAASTNNSLTHSGTHALTVNGNVLINQPGTNNRTTTWSLNAGSATVAGLITFAGTNTSRVSKIVITTGQLNAYGGLTFTASAASTKVIDMSGGAGRLNLKGNLTVPANSSTLTAGTAGSIFSYADNAAAQTLRFFSSGAYDHLYVNNASAGGATLGAAVTTSNVVGDLRVQSGALNNGGFAIAGAAGATFEVADGATFAMSGTSTLPTGYGTTLVGAASRIRYLQTTNPLTVSALSYGHLDLAAAGTATQRLPGGAVTVRGDLTVGDGVHAVTADLSANGTALTVNGGVTIAANATLVADVASNLAVAGNWSNAGAFTNNGSTVVFNGAAAQSVDNKGGAFGHLVDGNASAGGLTFPSGFSATELSADTGSLGGPATMYFLAGGAFTVGDLELAGAAARPVCLRSTAPGVRWSLSNTLGQSVHGAAVSDSDASGARFVRDAPDGEDNGNNVNWDFGPPSAVADLSLARDYYAGQIDLSWTAPGDAPNNGPLSGANFVIEYTTDAVFAGGGGWSPTVTPAGVSRVSLSTSVAAGDACATPIGGLIPGGTYYFRLWTQDNFGGYSAISNGPSDYATTVVSSVTLSTSLLALGSLLPGATVVYATPVTVTNLGNSTATFNVAIAAPAVWSPTASGAGLDTFRLSGLFRSSMPAAADFDVTNDVLSISTAAASAAAFARDADDAGQKGYNVPPNAARTLWFRIEMPPVSSTIDPQTIRLFVSSD